jgi:putative tryptophan/tyrosine transport system substrate-binding protein
MACTIKRREFVTLLCGTAATWPLSVHAQQEMPVIGFLSPLPSPGPNAPALAGLRQGLKDAGYVEGQNVAIEYRWANTQLERLPALAADLVRREVAMIIAANGIGAATAAKAATSTIPIVLAVGVDPVKSGLVASLNRPGGNVTGVTDFTHELAAKRLELLRDLVPQATTVAYLTGDARHLSFEDEKSDILNAARALGREVIVLEVHSVSDFEAAFATIVERRAGALTVGAFPILLGNSNRIVALAAQHKIPAVYPAAVSVRRGGLMSFQGDAVDQYHQVGLYVGRILKGANPADLPVLQPTKFELVINLKTAKALGLKVPRALLVSATELIE